MFNKKTLRDLDVTSKSVLVRCDFNVPVKDGFITDDTRIIAVLPTIIYLIEHGARVILCSHMGKPKGKYDPAYSLAPVATRLSQILGRPVAFKSEPQVITSEIKEMVDCLADGEVMLLENTRFRPEETANGEDFAKELASLADIFVNDAFGTAHRAHASTEGVTHFVTDAVGGLLLEKELQFLGKAVEEAEHPFVAVMGGSKISDKIKVIEKLMEKVDGLIIGGGMAYTFLKAQGYPIGKSLVEEDQLDYALRMLDKAKDKGIDLLLPVDHLVADRFEDLPAMVTADAGIPEDTMGMDIGPRTRDNYVAYLSKAKTVLWNGPMGVFEFSHYSQGTLAIAQCLASLEAVTIIGGGDSAAAVAQLGFKDKMTHISTGGGASLKFLEGGSLPGIEALNSR